MYIHQISPLSDIVQQYLILYCRNIDNASVQVLDTTMYVESDPQKLGRLSHHWHWVSGKARSKSQKSNTKSRTINDGSFRFKDLPAEVRNMIYVEFFNITKRADLVTLGTRNNRSRMTISRNFRPQHGSASIFAIDRSTSQEAFAIYYHIYKVQISFNFTDICRWPGEIATHIEMMKHMQIELFSKADLPDYELARKNRYDRKLGHIVEHIMDHAVNIQTLQLWVLTPEWKQGAPGKYITKSGHTARALRALCQQSQHFRELTIVSLGREDALKGLRHSIAPKSAWNMTELRAWPNPQRSNLFRYESFSRSGLFENCVRSWRTRQFEPAEKEVLSEEADGEMVVGENWFAVMRRAWVISTLVTIARQSGNTNRDAACHRSRSWMATPQK